MSNAKEVIQQILQKADIHINGSRPWDIQVHNEDLYNRVIREGSLGLGESYMEGWWDCEELDEFFYRILHSQIEKTIRGDWHVLLKSLPPLLLNFQSSKRAFEVGKKHYDIGNDLYNAMLDSRLVYTCGYWKDAKTLDEAQEAKLDLVCRKIGLKPGMKVLDIGCGWGSFAKFAAEKYGVSVVGVTVSQEQVDLGNKLCEGLPVEIRLQDYRDIQNEQFDRIVSLGMFEHVGYKNYRIYMETAAKLLKDDGLFLLHTIGGNVSTYKGDPWIEKYIFPNGMIPSITQIGKALEDVFVMEDWHNFGYNYYLTLKAWYENFESHWDDLKSEYDETFHRMWKYYLLCCAGGFKARRLQLWQIVLSPHGVEDGYTSIR